MASKPWSRDELILAMNLYCRLPFGLFHSRNPDVIALANAIERTPSSVAMKLGNLASLDPYHRERGVKGLEGASRGDRAIWDEFHADWESLAVLSEKLRESLGLVEAESAATEQPEVVYAGETEAERPVRVRLAQRFFRQSVLAAYESRCCVTGISLSQLLIASHILPWSGFPEHRANPRNGLCLSRLHDAAFDQGLIGFDEDYRMVLSKELSDATTNDVLAACFQRYEGQPIQLPERFRPESTFLASHITSVFRT
jgi:putative restriction endonuclease